MRVIGACSGGTHLSNGRRREIRRGATVPAGRGDEGTMHMVSSLAAYFFHSLSMAEITGQRPAATAPRTTEPSAAAAATAVTGRTAMRPSRGATRPWRKAARRGTRLRLDPFPTKPLQRDGASFPV